MTITRRGFMKTILAAGVAPAFIGAKVLMPVRKLVIPEPEWVGFDFSGPYGYLYSLGVFMPSVSPGRIIHITNRGGESINVFPAAVEGGAIRPGEATMFIADSDGKWTSIYEKPL